MIDFLGNFLFDDGNLTSHYPGNKLPTFLILRLYLRFNVDFLERLFENYSVCRIKIVTSHCQKVTNLLIVDDLLDGHDLVHAEEPVAILLLEKNLRVLPGLQVVRNGDIVGVDSVAKNKLQRTLITMMQRDIKKYGPFPASFWIYLFRFLGTM